MYMRKRKREIGRQIVMIEVGEEKKKKIDELKEKENERQTGRKGKTAKEAEGDREKDRDKERNREREKQRESEKSANTMASRVIFVVLFFDKLLQSSLVYSIETRSCVRVA